MDFWDQDNEDKLIKKIEKDVEKWDSGFSVTAVDVNDQNHDEL